MEIDFKGIPRRSFLYGLGVALLMLFTFHWRGYWWPSSFGRKRSSSPTKLNRFKEGEKTLVSIVHEEMLKRA